MTETIERSLTPQADAAIELMAVSFAYPVESPIFQDLSFVFHPRSFYLIQGPSGGGKSSLLKLINRLEEPQSGGLFYKGRPLITYRPQDLRRQILYIQQTPVVIDGSVKDNLLLPFTFKNNSDLTPPDDERLKALLAEFRLDRPRLSDNALNLSVGQQQRLCLIRGLLLNPEMILLDEPTSALDAESAQIVESWVAQLCRDQGQTVIMVSHKEFQTTAVQPTVLELTHGRLRKVA